MIPRSAVIFRIQYTKPAIISYPIRGYDVLSSHSREKYYLIPSLTLIILFGSGYFLANHSPIMARESNTRLFDLPAEQIQSTANNELPLSGSTTASASESASVEIQEVEVSPPPPYPHESVIPPVATQPQDIKNYRDLGIQMPLSSYRSITTPFSWAHPGIDMTDPIGTPVSAASDGIVSFAGWDSSGYGNCVVIDNGEILTRYAHLSEITILPGAPVSRGAVIGTVGKSGNATGPHLHFEIYDHGLAVDPAAFIHS